MSARSLDTTDQDSVEQAVRTIQTTRRRLDILVNNAAAHPDHWPHVSVPDLDEAARTLGVDTFLFTTRRGACLRAANGRSRGFNRAVREAGLDGTDLAPHELRHTTASLAIAAEADVMDVGRQQAAKRLGKAA